MPVRQSVTLAVNAPAVTTVHVPMAVDARYLVLAPSDPGLLPRLVEPFSKLGTIPTRVHASREAGDGSEMTVDLRLAHADPRTAELIEHALRRVVGVHQLIAVVEPSL